MTAMCESLLTSVPAGRGDSGSLEMAFRVAFVTEEWIPPQRPLSDDTTTKSFVGVGLSEGVLAKTSGAELEQA